MQNWKASTLLKLSIKNKEKMKMESMVFSTLAWQQYLSSLARSQSIGEGKSAMRLTYQRFYPYYHI